MTDSMDSTVDRVLFSAAGSQHLWVQIVVRCCQQQTNARDHCRHAHIPSHSRADLGMQTHCTSIHAF